MAREGRPPPCTLTPLPLTSLRRPPTGSSLCRPPTGSSPSAAAAGSSPRAGGSSPRVAKVGSPRVVGVLCHRRRVLRRRLLRGPPPLPGPPHIPVAVPLPSVDLGLGPAFGPTAVPLPTTGTGGGRMAGRGERADGGRRTGAAPATFLPRGARARARLFPSIANARSVTRGCGR